VTGPGCVYEDAHLLSEMARRSRSGRLVRGVCHRLLAALLWVALAVPYAVLAFMLKRQRRWHQGEKTFLADNTGRTIRLTQVSFEPDRWAGRLAQALALDRFPLLGSVPFYSQTCRSPTV
jgi:hypothetical protein